MTPSAKLPHGCLPLLVVVMLACLLVQGGAVRGDDSDDSVDGAGPVSGLTFDEAVKLWCDSSLEVMILGRELRKVDPKDVAGFHQKLMRIGELVEGLNKVQVADVKEDVEGLGKVNAEDDLAMPNLDEARRQVGAGQKKYLGQIIQRFRDVDVVTYIEEIAFLREGPKEDRLPDSKVNPTGPFPYIKAVKHGWIRHDWKDKSGLEFFRSSVDKAVQRIPWLKNMMAHLKLDLSEMLGFGLDAVMRHEVNETLMRKVFGNFLKDKLSMDNFQVAEGKTEQKKSSCTRKRNWMDKLQCQAAIGVDCIKEHVISKVTLFTSTFHHGGSSLLSESSNSSDDEDQVGHALSVTSSQLVGSQRSTHAVTGSLVDAIAFFLDLIGILIPMLFKWAFILVLGAIVLAALVVATPIMILAFGAYYAACRANGGLL